MFLLPMENVFYINKVSFCAFGTFSYKKAYFQFVSMTPMLVLIIKTMVNIKIITSINESNLIKWCYSSSIPIKTRLRLGTREFLLILTEGGGVSGNMDNAMSLF